MDCKSLRILIYGGGLQGLSVGESLYGSYDLSIISKDLQVRRSRYFNQVYNNINDESDFYKLLESEHFDILLPIADACVPFCSKNKEFIEKKYAVKVAVPQYPLVELVTDKGGFMSFCSKYNFPHPNTSVINAYNIEQVANIIGFPSLIKPDRSVGARGITKVNNIEELVHKYSIVNGKFGNCTLQEYIDNEEYYYNVMLYRDSNGIFLAHTIMKILRVFPIKAGSSTCCISVDNPQLLEICKNVLDKMNWIGMADFDVLQRLDNGEYKIIEINPRVPASLRAASISGVNFPDLIIRDALGMIVMPFEYKPGKVLRYLGTDVLWLLKTKRLFGNEPNWWHFLGKELYYQDILLKDVSTWWTWLAEGIIKLLKRRS